VAARIKKAYDDGRIGVADRDIRLGNVRSAQSMAELDLMTRDLDQLEAALAPTPAQPVVGAETTPSAPWSTFNPKSRAGTGSPAGARRTVTILFLLVGIAVIVAAVAAVIGLKASDDEPNAAPAAPAAPGPQDPGAPDVPQPDEPDQPTGPAYTLTRAGIQDFLTTYRRKFGTSRVVDLTFYQDYVIVDVPVPGKARQSGWLFRESKWTDFGGVRATFPGSVVVDTNRLDIPALTRNIARARRTLNVEAPSQAYVILRWIKPADEVPSVDIHVVNKFQESGYLATTLDGKVERAYPYDR
jgi:hypothetical protein